MKISVAIATYNGEKYIEEQLQSILQQTRAVDEVILTDDRSTDRTVTIVEEFIKRNELSGRWIISVNPTNLGFGENFRKAINLTTGDYIFPCDQDDIWVPDRIEKMTAVMEKNPDIALLNTKYTPFHDGENIKKANSSELEAVPERIALNKYTRFLRSLGCLMCVRKSFYDEVKENWYEGWAHDEFLWSMAMLYGRCYQWNYSSIWRRFHQKQVSGHMGHSKEKRIRYLSDVQKSSEFLLQLAEKINTPKSVQNLYKKNVVAHQYRLELIRDKKLFRAFRLLLYIGYYYSAKSYLIELGIAWKG